MTTIDIAIAVLLLIGAYTGYKKGLLMEVVSWVAFFIAIILGIRLLDWGIATLSEVIGEYETALPIIAFAIIFIAIVLVLNLIGKTLKTVLDMTLLGSFDNIAGALLGIVKWTLLISIFIWIYESFGGKIPATAQASLLFEPIAGFAPNFFNILSRMFPFVIEFFDRSKEAINPQGAVV